MSELLAFQAVHSGYGDARVLHGVDISVSDNERVAIVGRNGVGKTTVVNTFLGVARLTAVRSASAGRPSARCAASPRRAAASPWCRRDGASSRT